MPNIHSFSNCGYNELCVIIYPVCIQGPIHLYCTTQSKPAPKGTLMSSPVCRCPP